MSTTIDESQSTASSRTAATPPAKNTALKKPGKFAALTGWAKTVALYYDSNKIECADPDHYAKVTIVEANKAEALDSARLKDKMPRRKKASDILSLMTPFKAAKCACEREACREAWKWNKPGVFQSEWVQEPNMFKGIGKWSNDAPMKRVMPVQFRLSTSDFKVLHERFPDWHFAVVGNGGHDHPISHVTTQVVTHEELMRLKAGKSYLDMHGNPTANERYTSGMNHAPTLDTYVSMASAKDFGRKILKYGPEVTKEGKRRYTQGPILSNRWHKDASAAVADNRDGFLSFHTGYYYEPVEILSVLKRSPEATFTMLMHRFKGQDGTLNNGELAYRRVVDKVTGRTKIVQTNVATNEPYSHPDNEHWFQKFSWTDVSPLDAHARDDEYESPRGLTWTVGRVCEDVFKVTIVAVPAYAVYLDETVDAFVPPSDPVERYGGVDIKIGDSVEFVKLPGKCAPLFDQLRKKMNHQKRTQDKFAAHVQTCAQKAELFRQEKGVELTAKELSCIQLASFWVDFDHDAMMQTSISESAGWVVERHASMLKGNFLGNKKNRNALVLTTVVALLKSNSTTEVATTVAGAVAAMNGNT